MFGNFSLFFFLSLFFCVFFCLLYFLLHPFEELGCFSECLMSSASIQKLFCGIYSTFKCSFDEFVGEKVFSPSYSSAILAPPPAFFKKAIYYRKLGAHKSKLKSMSSLIYSSLSFSSDPHVNNLVSSLRLPSLPENSQITLKQSKHHFISATNTL